MNRVEFAFFGGDSKDDEYVLLEVTNGKPNLVSKGKKKALQDQKAKLEKEQEKLIKKYVVRKASNIWA